jgi:hypothetical protein
MSAKNLNDGGVDPWLVGAEDIGRNALWNYVSAIVWLRWLRRCKVAFNLLPIICGSLGSWRILVDQPGNAGLAAAALAFAAGLVPLLYLATGIEDSISSITRISGKYRVVEARARDFVIRFDVLVAEERRRLYQEMQDQLLQLKEEAHTIPRWAFISAERLIKQKEYSPVTISMRGGGR